MSARMSHGASSAPLNCASPAATPSTPFGTPALPLPPLPLLLMLMPLLPLVVVAGRAKDSRWSSDALDAQPSMRTASGESSPWWGGGGKRGERGMEFQSMSVAG